MLQARVNGLGRKDFSCAFFIVGRVVVVPVALEAWMMQQTLGGAVEDML
jgi:hypothetical protein